MTRRRGFALVLSLLMMLALGSLTAGMLVVGTRDAMIHASHVRVMAARRAAEARVRTAIAAWSTAEHRDLLPGEERTLGSGLRVARLDAELYLLRAELTVEGTRGVAAALVATVSADRLMDELAGVAVVEGQARILSGRIGRLGDCPPPDSLAGLVAGSATVEPGAEVRGAPPVRLVADPPPPPGPAAPTAAALLATLSRSGGALTPMPRVVDGECVVDETSWGSVRSWSPCHGALPYVHVRGDTELRGGEARGILVVEGDLRITDGARIDGVVVVTGELTVGSGAEIRGAVHAGSLVVAESTLLFDACVVAAAAGAPALDRGFRPAGRWWVPAF